MINCLKVIDKVSIAEQIDISTLSYCDIFSLTFYTFIFSFILVFFVFLIINIITWLIVKNEL